MKQLLNIALILTLVVGTSNISVGFSNIDFIEDSLEFPNVYITKYSTLDLEVIVDPNFISTISFSQLLKDLNQSSVSYRITNRLTSNYTLNLYVQALSQEQKQSFESYLRSIEINGTGAGHEFNETAFELGKKGETFPNVTGRSYDADLSLKWIRDNFWSQKTNVYSLYIFNLTTLDRGMDHWFTINPVDMDSNISHGAFFSGTHGLDNGRQLSAWGGYPGLPLHFIDLSSETWFGDFINFVWDDFGFSDTIISKKLQDFGTGDYNSMVNWIDEYLTDFIKVTYRQRLFSLAPLGDTVHMETIFLYDWQDYNLSTNDVSWLYHTQIIEEKLNTSFPWMEFAVTDKWKNLSDFSYIENEMEKYKSYNSKEQRYEIELTTGFLSYLSTNVVPSLFNFEGYDIILPSLVFLLNNTVFLYNGIPIAGLGGMGYQLQGLTPERYYDTEGEPERGLSLTLLHEIGHSLGLPHPFYESNSWIGDFTASLMGYYTHWPNFSQYDINSMGFRHSDYYLIQAEYFYSEDDKDHQYVDLIEDQLTFAQISQEKWDFNSSIVHSKEILRLYEVVFNLNACDPCPTTTTSQKITSDIISDTGFSSQEVKSDLFRLNIHISWVFAVQIIILVYVKRFQKKIKY